MSATKPNHEEILLQLCASLTLGDHMGDVGDDVLKALERAGVKVESDDDGEGWCDDVSKTLAARGITTLYGTKLRSDGMGDDDE